MITTRALLAASAIALAAPAAAEEITASVWFPDTHPLTRDGYLALADEVKALTNGDLTVQVYTGTALLPPIAHLSGLQDGIVQMTYHAGTYTPSDLPEDNTVASLAISLPDSMVTTLAVADFYLNDPDMQAMFDRLGMVFLGSYATPQYILMCSKEVKSLDDMRGKKLRMPSPMHAAWAESVGAVPVNVPSSEMFSGLEKGQLDCAVNAANDMKARSLWDVAKYTTMLELGPYFAGWLHAMSDSAWQGLSDEHRKAMIQAIPSRVVDTTVAQQEAADEALAEAPDHGVTVIEPSEELAQSLAAFVSGEMDGITVSTGEKLGVKDPAALAQRFKDTYAKWEGLLAEVPEDDLDTIKQIFRTEVYDKLDLSSYGL
jgi:TRAP-type C4-dicarboxylate transport system substrate-binding protein